MAFLSCELADQRYVEYGISAAANSQQPRHPQSKDVQVQVLSRAPILNAASHPRMATSKKIIPRPRRFVLRYWQEGRWLMRVRFLLSSTIVAALATFCGGCVSATADKRVEAEPEPAMRALGQPVSAPAPAGEEVSTESIGSQIRRQLSGDPGSTAGIIVEVDGETVTLRGTAPTIAASWRAEAIAHATKGVKTVVNQIFVPPPPTMP